MQEVEREAVVSDDALSQESVILDVIEKQNFTNPKKLKKFAQRLLGVTTNRVQRYLLTDILVAKDPVKYTNECISKIRDCAAIIQQFVDDGCHGMIMIKNNVYPVVLDTQKTWLAENKAWHPDDESLIQHQAAEMWMKEHDKGYFLGKVILFPNFGFSGVPNIIEMQCSTDVKGMKRLPGTNYFYDDIVKHRLGNVR